MSHTKETILAALFCAVVATGCSEGLSRNTITGPSATSEQALAAGPLNGDRSSSSRPATSSEAAAWAAAHRFTTMADGIALEATDTITAVSDACPAKIITIRGVPVTMTAETTYAAPLTCAGLTVGTAVTVNVLVVYTDTGYTVTATSIAAAAESEGSDDGEEPVTGPGNGGKKARGEGVIGAITGSCPTLTLVITGTRVSTTSTTQYVNGTCQTLRPGTKVTIDGVLKPGGKATAEKIEIHRVPGQNAS